MSDNTSKSTAVLGLTPEKYAEIHGVSVDEVHLAIDKRQLTTCLDGSIDPESPPIGMSQAEFARYKGVSREAVSKASKSGRLVYHVDGSINADASINSWANNANPRAGSGDSLIDDDAPNYMLERARREKAAADKAEMDVARLRGELLDARKVRNEIFEIFKTARDAILKMPDMLAGELTGKTDTKEVHAIIDRHTRAALSAAEQALETITDE